MRQLISETIHDWRHDIRRPNQASYSQHVQWLLGSLAIGIEQEGYRLSPGFMAEAFVKIMQNVREGDFNELESFAEELFMQGVAKDIGRQLNKGWEKACKRCGADQPQDAVHCLNCGYLR